MNNIETIYVKWQETHKQVVHDKCEKPYCAICDGGLLHCSVCGSAEGGSTTHCPGEMMDASTQEQVYAGEIDYRDGKWVPHGSPWTPNRGWDLMTGVPLAK